MGEHGIYIWSSYAASAVVLIGLFLYILYDLGRQKALFNELESRGAARRKPARATATPSVDPETAEATQ